jgi:ankyrin repeat protein
VVDDREFADAIIRGDLTAVEALLNAGVDPDEVPPEGVYSPFLLAIEHGQVEVARRLITAGADVNGNDGSPLVHAIDAESDGANQEYGDVSKANSEMIELLLAAGAAPTARAFQIASSYGNEKALALLRQYAVARQPHNPPMQRTGPGGIFSFVRRLWAGR